jgi:hypothetical protein
VWGSSPLRTSVIIWPTVPAPDERASVGGMRTGSRNRSTGRKPTPVPLCPPQIPQDLKLNQTRDAAGTQTTNSLSYRHGPKEHHLNALSRVWLWTGFGLVNGFIDHLYTRLGTTSNYGAIANLHNSQITIGPVKPFSSLLCLHQPFPGKRLLTLEILQLHALRCYLHSFPCRTQLHWPPQLSSR